MLRNSEPDYKELDDNEVIDNSDISYSGKKIFLKYNTKKNRYEESRYRLDKSINTLKKSHPNLFRGCPDGNELKFLLDNVFTEGFAKTFYITNLTFKTSRDKKEILSIRPLKEGYYLEDSLPKNLTLIFKGHVEAGFFVIDEIKIGPDSEYRSCEIEIFAQPFHTNIPSGRRDDFLKEILETSTSLTDYTEKKLSEWEDFIAWRKEIAKKKILGGKYFNIEYDCSTKLINFYMVFENEDEFKSFRKYLRRDVKAFSNSYSDDPFRFKFSYNEKKKNYDIGVELGRFKRIEDSYYLKEKFKDLIDEISNTESINLERTAEAYKNISDDYIDMDYEEYEDNGDYKDIDRDYELDNKKEIPLEILLKEFDNPYIVIASYELRSEQIDEIEENYLSTSDELNYINDCVINEFNKQGFLALSGVGEFALLRRFEMAISQLKRDESNAPNLALWLFNIEHAKTPDKSYWISINKWFNTSIQSNRDQMLAVEKMINTSDVSLIQGPPGTGKTTVIAEAIYQFVSRGQRVLVASQSNDAVDNALERLAETPSIRAIRLGQKNRKKRLKDEDLISKFSEEKAIESFYKSISNTLEKDYIVKWEESEIKSIEYTRHLRDYRQYNSEIEKLSSKKQTTISLIKDLEEIVEKLSKDLTTIKITNRSIGDLMYQMDVFKEFLSSCNGTFLIPIKELTLIVENIKPIIDRFFKVGIDLCSGIALNTDNLEISNGNLLIQLIVNNLDALDKLINKADTSENKGSKNVDSSLIDAKINKIQEDMLVIDDDFKLMKLIKEMQELKKEKENLLKQSNSIGLSNREKAIFNTTANNKIYNNGELSTYELKRLLNKCKEISKELHNTFDYSIEKITSNYLNMKKDESEIALDIDKNNSKIKTLTEQIKIIDEKIEYFKSEVNSITQIYNSSDNEDISSAIENLKKENEKELEDNKLFRNHFENLIINFKKRLDDTSSYKYDKEYYEEIYINACNVVGISCTDNMRVLTDKGYDDFDVVIIDEVSKATPPELLIPLMKARKAILVGDHRQLPPLFNEHEKSYKEIINSKNEDDEDENLKDLLTEENFSRFKNMVTASLFKDYFERADESIRHSLFTQYRMHSDIMNIINRFYDGRLNNGLDKETEDTVKKHDLRIRGIDGTRFIVPEKHAYWIDSSRLPNQENFYESRPLGSTSAENILECFLIIELLKKMAKEYSNKGFDKDKQKTVGVISFYQLQVNRIRALLKKERKTFDFSSLNIDINTVDRFQGKEKQIIITSLVRNLKVYKRSEESHIAAFERINVAFSRAQEMLVIIGAKDMYSEQPVKLPNMDSVGEKTVYVYKNIIEELNRNACYFGSGKLLGEEYVEKIKDFMEKEYK